MVDELRLPIGGTVVVAASNDGSEELIEDISVRVAILPEILHTKNNRATASDHGNAFSVDAVKTQRALGKEKDWRKACVKSGCALANAREQTSFSRTTCTMCKVQM